ncbi:MAG: regulator of protease activity HflC (stomatin/prohibitin superfamily) [Candidatus Marinamargulisbacteria bacterium]|jgi:regulator of protease activity HflC (stomatin/prohibitin superfamily)
MIPKTLADLKKIAEKVFNTSLVISGIGLVLILLIFIGLCFTYIRPYEAGIKQVNIGIKRGIQPNVYPPGFHFVMPFGFEEMHRFPKNIQVFELTNNPHLQFGNFYQKAAHIQTSDGFFVDVDVSILYRITDPFKVIKTVGPGSLYIENGIVPKAEPILKDTLGQLTTEEFYNPHLRVEKMKLAEAKLSAELAEKGIGIEHVLVRHFRYSDEIQNNIEDKKLKDQLVFKNQAEAKAAMEAANLTRIIEEGEAILKIELEKGKAYVIRKRATQDLYSRKKHASADLLVSRANAYRTKLNNSALKVKGSENMVGLKMAEVFEGIDLIVLPSDGKGGLNPLDLDAVLELID